MDINFNRAIACGYKFLSNKLIWKRERVQSFSIQSFEWSSLPNVW